MSFHPPYRRDFFSFTQIPRYRLKAILDDVCWGIPYTLLVSYTGTKVPLTCVTVRGADKRTYIPEELFLARILARDLRVSVFTHLPEGQWVDGFWLLVQANGEMWTVPEVATFDGSLVLSVDRQQWRPFRQDGNYGI